MSLSKFVAVTAVAACAGGGVVLGGGVSGGSPSTPVVLDHYLCSDQSRGSDCDPVTVALPGSTTVDVTNPSAELECRRSAHGRRHSDDVATNVDVTNELTATPVALEVGNKRMSCAVERHGHRLAKFSCFSVDYPSGSDARFDPPTPLRVADRYDVTALDPSQLCIPRDGDTAGAANGALLCFDMQLTEQSRRRHHRDSKTGLLCVPSTVGSTTPGTGSSTSTSVSTTTTTTEPATTTTESTTTTTEATTTTTEATTTTTTPTSQPCPGEIIDGDCITEG
jgi:hypothetical protein